ncbi:prephenate dehydrogenase/arogenate dehydrogenase family protein [Vogesella sp. LIG4]|uniref:prephenate dehydrogenase n=1 Tax=Vogesella sp. LIG4 TaxID=1192162 RepID=UPI00081FB0F5|nr:prephenate dehydrogenase/arogenate dehydrogenase family protein [Vogesella sp. LIG4]SCK19616.1 prephenate dehydrogenase [Vogesella sp. LIG4]
MQVGEGGLTLVVIGVGLIGGSFALALKRAGKVARVIGVGRSAANLQRAVELGVIDEASHDAATAVARADLVLVATPVGQMGRVFAEIAPHLPADCVLTDGGSTKSDVVALMRQHLPGQLAHCVPAHPIAGSDLSGAAAAQYGLYDNRRIVVTPLPETDPTAAELVRELWQACGARVYQMSAGEHDAVFATVSHLPHLLAFAYVDAIVGKADAERCFDFAATGFRDFTRIAGSHPEMWRDIALANRDALLVELDTFQQTLDALRAELEAGDAEAMMQRFERARAARQSWQQKFNRGNA